MPQLLVIGQQYDVVIQDADRSFRLKNARLEEAEENFLTFTTEDGRLVVYNVRAVTRIESPAKRGL